MPSINSTQIAYFGSAKLEKRLNWSALSFTGVIHVAVVAALFSQWEAHPMSPVAERTMAIQLVQLPQKVVEPVSAPKPPPEIIKPESIPEKTQVKKTVVETKPVKKPVVKKQEYARKRVEEPQKKPKVEKPVVAEKPNKPVAKSEPVIKKQPVKETQTAAAATVIPSTAKPAKKNSPLQSSEVADKTNVKAYLPIEKKAPDYPRAAIRKGLQGDCTVAYSVDKQGHVQSPKIVGECHPLFARPSIAAAEQFLYAPKMVNGHPVVVKQVHNTFEYRIN